MTDPNSQDALAASIAAENGFTLYKQYTEKEAASLLRLKSGTLRNKRVSNQLGYIQLSERCIRYLGYHLANYLIKNLQCPDTINRENSNSVHIGYQDNPEALLGAALGSTQKPDKQKELALALQILKTPKKH